MNEYLDVVAALDDEFAFECRIEAPTPANRRSRGLEGSATRPKGFTQGPFMVGVSRERDELPAEQWSGCCWVRPPYGREIRDWVIKAQDAAKAGATVVCLVPGRTETGWFQDHCARGEVRFLVGRVRFPGERSGAPFPSAVVVFRPGGEPGVEWWNPATGERSRRFRTIANSEGLA